MTDKREVGGSSPPWIATHRRSWSKKQKIVDCEHIEAIVKSSRAKASRSHRSQVLRTLSSGCQLFQAWHEIDENLQVQSRKIRELIECYGGDAVDAAAELALENGTPRVDSIEHILQCADADRKPYQPHYVRKDLPDYVPEPHDLELYDQF